MSRKIKKREEKMRIEQNELSSLQKQKLSSLDYLDMHTTSAGSAGDMTGLIPAKPMSDDELESYEALYSHDPVIRQGEDPGNC